MKLHGDITINNKQYKKGMNIPWKFIYPFFLVHMAAFGSSGFFLAYGNDDVTFLYMHGGLAIFVYTVFYFAIFGLDEVKWMFTNAALGLFGIYSEIDWILSAFDKHASDFPWYVHLIPFLYYVLYTFLIRQAFIDISGSRNNPERRRIVDYLYVGLSITIYSLIYFTQR